MRNASMGWVHPGHSPKRKLNHQGMANSFSAESQFEKSEEFREITYLSNLSVSSFKPGFGVSQLKDSSIDIFWQSDGQQPHYILFSFQKRTMISGLSIYVDFKQDESYSPKLISIKVGTCIDTLQEVAKKSLIDLVGWFDIPLSTGDTPFVETFLLQLTVLLNYQNGKDTHIRAVKLWQAKDPFEE